MVDATGKICGHKRSYDWKAAVWTPFVAAVGGRSFGSFRGFDTPLPSPFRPSVKIQRIEDGHLSIRFLHRSSFYIWVWRDPIASARTFVPHHRFVSRARPCVSRSKYCRVKMIRAGPQARRRSPQCGALNVPLTRPSLQVERHAVFLTQLQVPRHSCACAGSERFAL
jgi:hypothetical protein